MENFVTNFGTWIALGGLFVVGVVSLYGLFDKRSRERRKTENETEDRVIVLLQTEVKELTKRVTKQDEDIKELTRKVDALESENETLVKVLQGRDDATQQFYKDAYVAMEQIKNTHDIAMANNKHISDLVDLMKKMLYGHNK